LLTWREKKSSVLQLVMSGAGKGSILPPLPTVRDEFAKIRLGPNIKQQKSFSSCTMYALAKLIFRI